MPKTSINLNKKIFNISWLNPLRGLQFYFLLLCLLSSYYLFRWPIMAGDTDLWYHLNGGRYILGQHSIPTTSFFSFMSPLREWINYYWLFQVLVFKIYSWADYYGLIIFRGVIYLGTILLLFLYLSPKQKEDRFQTIPVFIFAFFLIFLLPRTLLVRPHSLSYLFIILFLYILEFHPKKVIALPFLAVLWNNLHGIEYPIMLLIVGAYILDFLINHIRSKIHVQRSEISYIIPLICCMATVYLTPHGAALMGVVVTPTDYASQYINELKIQPFKNFFSFYISPFSSNPLEFFNLLFILALISLGHSILRLRVKISHLVMIGGGFFLISKASRLIYEFAFLSLPFLRAFPWRISLDQFIGKAKLIAVLSTMLVFLLPPVWLKSFFIHPPKFPFSEQRLPTGVTAFLNRISVGGTVLNHPNKGGYLQWMLYPNYQIFMDMEVPFLFTDEDFLIAHNAFSNEEVFKKIILKYRPSFISVPITEGKFKEIIEKYPDYKLVFFDHAEVLYADSKQLSGIAAKYAIKDVDPFELSSKGIDLAIHKKGGEALLQVLCTLLEINPECSLKSQVVGMIYNKRGEYQQALSYADSMIRNAPESSMGYRIKGDALTGLKLYSEAICSYEWALERSGEAEKRTLYRQIGYVYNEQRNFRQAYAALKKGINVFDTETTYRDLFDLGATALSAGKAREAYSLLTFARSKLPHDEAQWTEKIDEKLSLIKIGG